LKHWNINSICLCGRHYSPKIYACQDFAIKKTGKIVNELSFTIGGYNLFTQNRCSAPWIMEESILEGLWRKCLKMR